MEKVFMGADSSRFSPLCLQDYGGNRRGCPQDLQIASPTIVDGRVSAVRDVCINLFKTTTGWDIDGASL